MQEEWRTVVGYEGLYEVSNTGKVRSLNRAIEVTRNSRIGNAEAYVVTRAAKELKPYGVTKSNRVKFHLHKRIAHGGGSHAQSDEYLYLDDMVRAAFSQGS